MMIKALLSNLDFEAVQDRVLYYNRANESGVHIPIFFYQDLIAQQVDYLIAVHVALARDVGGWPWPEMLHHLGWAGRLIHKVFCRRSGMWAALNELVMRRQPDAPFFIPQDEQYEQPDSKPERFVCRRVRLLPGIIRVQLHPRLPGGLSRMMKADLLVTAATGRTVYVESTMVPLESHADNEVYIKYRNSFARKLDVYKTQRIEPFVIWADQSASPRALAEVLNNLLARLDLPTRPPLPRAWFESEVL